MADQQSSPESLPPDLAKALREVGIDPDSEAVLDAPVPVSHASGPSEHQSAIDDEIKREWRQRRSDSPDD